MSETIRIGDEEITPVVIRGVPCLSIAQAALFVGKSGTGLMKSAPHIGLTRVLTPLNRRAVYFPVVQLQALKAGYRIPAVNIEEEEEPVDGLVRKIDPDLIDGVPCLDGEQAAYYLTMQEGFFVRWARERGLAKRVRDGVTYYALAQIIAWKRREKIPDVEW